MNELQDTDKMPFGKHKDTIMQEVPASYLHYLWTNGMKEEMKPTIVSRYIERNLLSLQAEYKNGIW